MKKGTKKISKQIGISEALKGVIGDDLFKVTLKSLGRIYKSEGTTFKEALEKIKISGGAKVVSILTVEKDGVKHEKIINPAHTNGLFGQGSPTTREIHLKGVKQLLGL